MKLKEAAAWKRREDRPSLILEMAEFFSEHGWTLWEEWQEPWMDEETGEEHGGWWGYHLVHEEMIGNKLHMLHLFPIRPTPYREAWEQELKLGQMGWEHYREGVS